jgi:hypothetical protein
MDLEKRFCAIRDFLKQHEYLHELEVMERYPFPLKAPYDQWTKELQKLDAKDLLQLECFGSTQALTEESMISYFEKAWVLAELPKYAQSDNKLKGEITRKMTPKKIHEIEQIQHLLQDEEVETLVDIGSGAGYLSSALLINNNLKSFCVDMNDQFQQQGKKKLQNWFPELLDRLTFVHAKVDANSKFDFIQNTQKTLLLGLHACGPLSTTLVRHFEKGQYGTLLNFGCCYHKMQNEYNLSAVAKSEPINFSNHALTMAAKCHSVFSPKEIHQRYLVKRFRYSLHFYAQDVLKTPFETLGNASAKDYQGSFSDYAKKYYPAVHDIPAQELEEYFHLPSTQQKVHYAMVAGIIRSALGRLIEIYINLDRALYLQEHGHQVVVAETFKRELSPRNIAILAKNTQ